MIQLDDCHHWHHQLLLVLKSRDPQLGWFPHKYTSCYFMSFYMFGLTTVFVREYTCLTIPILAHGMRFKSLEPSVTTCRNGSLPFPTSSSWQLQSVEHALHKLEPLREFPTSTGPASGTATSRTSCLFNITGHARDS
jgi:hypothetical protein